MAPKVSIVVPVLNGAKFIDRAMGYLESQTFKDFETILVVDTRSIDDTVRVAESYSDSARIVIKDVPGSLGVSRNMGVNVAKGEFIWYMDIDDHPLPNLLERMIRIQDEHGADIVGCNFIYSSDIETDYDLSKYKFKVRVMTSEEAIKARSEERFPVTAWSKIYRRSMLIENDIEFVDRFCEDIEYTYRALSCSNKVCYTEEPLYIYYQHEKSYCMSGAQSDDRGKAEQYAYRNLEQFLSTTNSKEVNRRNALTRIRSSGHMTYRSFIDYAKSKECRWMLRRYCSDPIVPEAMWYRFFPSAYYVAIRVFFRLMYYRDGRIYTDPTGIPGFTHPKKLKKHN